MSGNVINLKAQKPGDEKVRALVVTAIRSHCAYIACDSLDYR